MNISSLSTGALQRPDLSDMRRKLFEKADADGSGTLNKDELLEGLKDAPKGPEGSGPDVSELFDKMDVDGSGEVTEEEMKAFDEAREAEHQSLRQTLEKGGSASLSGSSEMLQQILEELQGEEDDSGEVSSTDTDSKKRLYEKLLQVLNEDKRQYLPNGAPQAVGKTNLFSSEV